MKHLDITATLSREQWMNVSLLVLGPLHLHSPGSPSPGNDATHSGRVFNANHSIRTSLTNVLTGPSQMILDVLTSHTHLQGSGLFSRVSTLVRPWLLPPTKRSAQERPAQRPEFDLIRGFNLHSQAASLPWRFPQLSLRNQV